MKAIGGTCPVCRPRTFKKAAHRGKIRIVTDPVESAREAGLRYVSDDRPGIRRVRRGKGFRYVGTDDKPVRDPDTLRRIRSLAIPPAWTDVWICPLATGHLQATGHDARGRKQYRYHPRWRAVRDETKYDRMIAFAQALPHIRARVEQDLAQSGLPRMKVLATVVRLLETTLIRVGNEEYARDNGSFGLTTLRNRHVNVEGQTLRFSFKGKSGVRHSIYVDDRRLARIVQRCQDLPGQELFQYLDDDGTPHDIDSADVNAYLQEIAGQEFTAKDFRTWAGTVLAARALQELETFDSQAQAKRNIVAAIESVAKRLGNTKAVCRKCYVHPGVINAYLDGSLLETLRQRVEKEIAGSLHALPSEEAAVLAFLQERLKHEAEARAQARSGSDGVKKPVAAAPGL
jgi:DNA topoisomerase I